MQLACCSENCGDCECLELTERETSVCDLLCKAQAPMPFNEIRRRTSMHQEVLSRIVRRLVVHGAAEKVDGGYVSRCGQ